MATSWYSSRRAIGPRPGTTCVACASTLPDEFPGVTFFFVPADIVNHGLEPRTAGADRCPGRRTEQDGRLRRRPAARGGDAAHPGRRGRRVAAGREHAGTAVHSRPGSRPGDRADPAPGREQSPHLAVVQRANSAQFLAQSAEWRQLQRRRAYAYLQAQLARSAGQHTGDGAGSGPSRSCSATSRPPRATRRSRS